MPRKTKIIFIIVFAVIGMGTLSAYFYINRAKTTGSTDGASSGYKPFFGSSNTPDTETTSQDQTGNTDTNVNTESAETINATPSGSSRFSQIANFAVAGAVFFEDTRPIPEDEVALPGGEEPAKEPSPVKAKTKTAPVKPQAPKFEIVPSLRYVERATGHIHQMYLDTKVTGQVSNGTIPTVYEALFDGKANSLLYRYIGDDGRSITSFLATLGSANGEFLPADILDVSVSPDKSKFFYLTKTAQGVVGTTRSFRDTKKTQIFSSSLTELLSEWVTDQKVFLTTKADSSVNGSVFSLNTGTGVLTKILGGVKGLTTLANNDGSFVLYSVSTNSGPRLGIFDVKNHTSKDLNINGLPEKCIWKDTFIYCAIPNNATGTGYPELWYRGQVSFTDHFVKINTTTYESTTLADSAYEIPIDGTHLFLDDTDTTLFFINKKDSTLWSLNLK